MKPKTPTKVSSTILGIDKLTQILGTEHLDKLEKAALRHLEQSNITFTILSVVDNQIEIEALQGETRSGKYAKEATLISRTADLFGKFLPTIKLHINPVPFAPSPTSTVTTAWLETKMQQKGIRIKQIAFETGIDRDSISDWVTGKRSMSQIVKAMFYFYFSR
jgi:hypothetical protein